MVFQNDTKKEICGGKFVFSGFDTTQRPLLAGVVLLILYILTVVANTANICFITTDKGLHRPMYIFICNLAVVDLISCTSSCPTMIAILIAGYKTISCVPCILQMFVFHICSIMEMLAITIMAIDRFVAISNPLRYGSIITNVRCISISIFLWLVSCSIISVLPASIANLPICFSTVKYVFCDYPTIIRATCVDPEPYFNFVSLISFVVIFGTFSCICLSYIKIAFVVKISSRTHKNKALNTCLSHFIVIVCYYVPTFTRIVLTRIGVVLTLEERNGLLVGSIIGPSLVNPFVYCFNTKHIRNKFFRTVSKVVQLAKKEH